MASIFRIEEKSKQETNVKAGDSRAVTTLNNTHLSIYYFLPPNFLHNLFFSPENGDSKFLRIFV
jgi:hypothetical protein